MLLDGLRISGVLGDSEYGRDPSQRREELLKISRACPKVVELDLSYNLIQKWEDVRDICEQLKKLQSLKIKYVPKLQSLPDDIDYLQRKSIRYRGVGFFPSGNIAAVFRSDTVVLE